MKKYLISGLFYSILSLASNLSAQQTISAAGGDVTVNISSSGQSDGVNMVGQNPNEVTLVVPSNQTVNSKKKSSPGKGYKVDTWGTTIGAEKSINQHLEYWCERDLSWRF